MDSLIVPKNRIKPTYLREQKTEALLIFIRTTLEQYFIDLDNNKSYLQMGSEEDNEIIDLELRKLLLKLQETVVNIIYIKQVISKSNYNRTMNILAKKEEPVMVYYNAIVQQLQISLNNGQSWIPEQLVLCLLSEWLIEEEKSTKLYPYLNDINYLSLLNLYEKVKMKAKKDNDIIQSNVILNMYKVGSELIKKLKSISYKINTSRKSKRKK